LPGLPKSLRLSTHKRKCRCKRAGMEDELDVEAMLAAQDALWRAAKRGDVAGIEAALLVEGVDVNEQADEADAVDDDGSIIGMQRLPLVWALLGGHLEAFRTLLAAGADPTIVDEDDLSIIAIAFHNGIDAAVFREAVAAVQAAESSLPPLHLASCVEDGGEAVAGMLSGAATAEERAAMLTATAPKRHDGGTALHFATASGNVGAVAALVAAGCDVHATDASGATALERAVQLRSLRVVQLLLAEGASVKSTKPSRPPPLLRACINGDGDMVNVLLAAGASTYMDEDWCFTFPLLEAARLGDVGITAALLAAGASVDKCTSAAALHDAATREVVTMLLAAGATVNLCGVCGSTPLLLAAGRDNVDVVHLLLAAGAVVNTAHDFGHVPLHQAALGGCLDIVAALLGAGAPVTAVTKDGETPLHLAAQEGHAAIVKVLVEHGADVNAASACTGVPMQYALRERHMDAVLALVAAGASANHCAADGTTPLLCAVRLHRWDAVNALLAAGADACTADAKGGAPLFWASMGGGVDAVHALLAAGADVNAVDVEGYTSLHIASQAGHVEVVAALLGAGAAVNAGVAPRPTVINFRSGMRWVDVLDGWEGDDGEAERRPKSDFESFRGATALELACAEGHVEVVVALLAAGANVKQADGYGRTPLSSAAVHGHLQTVKVLVAAGADVNQACEMQHSPLALASVQGQVKIMKVLLAAGANVHTINPVRDTALHATAYHGQPAAIQLLLESGADANAPNFMLWTPLHVACMSGRGDAAKALLAGGADPYARDVDGLPPLLTAVDNGHVAMIEVLRPRVCMDDMDNNGLTAVGLACQKGDIRMVTALLAAGAGPYVRDFELGRHLRDLLPLSTPYGYTVLHVAAATGNCKLATAAMAAGVKVDVLTACEAVVGSMATPLWVAAHYGQDKVVRQLLAAGADPAAKCYDDVSVQDTICCATGWRGSLETRCSVRLQVAAELAWRSRRLLGAFAGDLLRQHRGVFLPPSAWVALLACALVASGQCRDSCSRARPTSDLPALPAAFSARAAALALSMSRWFPRVMVSLDQTASGPGNPFQRNITGPRELHEAEARN